MQFFQIAQVLSGSFLFARLQASASSSIADAILERKRSQADAIRPSVCNLCTAICPAHSREGKMDGARKIVADWEPFNLLIFDMIRDGLVRWFWPIVGIYTYLISGLRESKRLQWTSHTSITMQCKDTC